MIDLLVTGAHGFVGRHLLQQARDRGLVVVASEGDLRGPTAAERLVIGHRPRAVVHLAERKPSGDDDVFAALADNLLMGGNILRAVAAHAPGAVVLMPGSAAEYGLGSAELLTETAPFAPVSAYGASKCVLELAFTTAPLTLGVRLIWARSFNHLGPGQPPNAPVAAWAQRAAAAERRGGGSIAVGNLDAVRDLLDVRDVAELYLDLLASPAVGVVNVCSGVPVVLRDVAEELVSLCDVPVSLERGPALVRTVDPPSVVGDPTRLRELVGHRPLRPWRETVAEVLDEWRRLPAGAAAEPARV